MAITAHQKTLLKGKEKEHNDIQVRKIEVRLGKRSPKILPDNY